MILHLFLFLISQAFTIDANFMFYHISSRRYKFQACALMKTAQNCVMNENQFLNISSNNQGNRTFIFTDIKNQIFEMKTDKLKMIHVNETIGLSARNDKSKHQKMIIKTLS